MKKYLNYFGISSSYRLAIHLIKKDPFFAKVSYDCNFFDYFSVALLKFDWLSESVLK
jgi:hypothetical protein